jgi:hypothetical protein
MTATSHPLSSPFPLQTSIRQKLLNIFVSPTDVFDEIIASPSNLANWRVPTLLVCLASIISLQIGPLGADSASAIHHLAQAPIISPAQTHALAGTWPLMSALSVCLATLSGTFWSAFVLWFIGHTFLKVSFPYLKALEIVGLTSIISVLGTIITILLIAVSGGPSAQPALSFLISKLEHNQRLYLIFVTFNFFYLWTTTVLAIGLSRLCRVSFKEAVFWVFGYWMMIRIGVVILQ